MTAILLAAAGVAGAAGLYAALMRWGGPELRGWAAPGAAALACGAVGHAFSLPSFVTVGAFLGLLFLLHRKARERLAAEAKAVGSLPFPDLGGVLAPIAVGDGGPVAAWSLPDPKSGEPMVFALEYSGEKDEDIRSSLVTRAPKFKPGVLVVHRQGLPGAAPVEAAPVEGLPGQPAEVVLRCLPPDFAFAVLDAPSLSLCADVLALARPDREVRIEANGPELRILCQGLPAREDIAVFLRAAAPLAARLRHLARLESA